MPWNLCKCAVSLSLVALLAGCSGSSSDLRITRNQTGEVYLNALPVGVADVQETGVIDLVTQCQTLGTTADCVPVQQTLHVRVLWRQGHAIKSRNKAISENAAIHWYITPAGRSDGSAGAAIVEYRGTGLVRIEREGQTVTLHIEQASLSPIRVVGAIADQLGPTTIAGSLVARIDAEQTAAAIGDLRATIAAARHLDGAEAKLTIEP